MVVARVILKKAQSYRVGSHRWLKDVPQTLKGDEVEEYMNNGYFSVTILKGGLPKKELVANSKEKVVLEDDDYDDDVPTNKSVAKKPVMMSLKKRN